jgi:hypothetical protein
LTILKNGLVFLFASALTFAVANQANFGNNYSNLLLAVSMGWNALAAYSIKLEKSG